MCGLQVKERLTLRWWEKTKNTRRKIQHMLSWDRIISQWENVLIPSIKHKTEWVGWWVCELKNSQVVEKVDTLFNGIKWTRDSFILWVFTGSNPVLTTKLNYMATLETQYKNYLLNNPDSKFTFEQWKEWLGNQLKEALEDLKRQKKLWIGETYF